jgi:hypothetical protein
VSICFSCGSRPAKEGLYCGICQEPGFQEAPVIRCGKCKVTLLLASPSGLCVSCTATRKQRAAAKKPPGRRPILNDQQVQSIRLAHRQGQTISELGKATGLSEITIRRVLQLYDWMKPYVTIEQWQAAQRRETKPAKPAVGELQEPLFQPAVGGGLPIMRRG